MAAKQSASAFLDTCTQVVETLRLPSANHVILCFQVAPELESAIIMAPSNQDFPSGTITDIAPVPVVSMSIEDIDSDHIFMNSYRAAQEFGSGQYGWVGVSLPKDKKPAADTSHSTAVWITVWESSGSSNLGHAVFYGAKTTSSPGGTVFVRLLPRQLALDRESRLSPPAAPLYRRYAAPSHIPCESPVLFVFPGGGGADISGLFQSRLTLTDRTEAKPLLLSSLTDEQIDDMYDEVSGQLRGITRRLRERHLSWAERLDRHTAVPLGFSDTCLFHKLWKGNIVVDVQDPVFPALFGELLQLESVRDQRVILSQVAEIQPLSGPVATSGPVLISAARSDDDSHSQAGSATSSSLGDKVEEDQEPSLQTETPELPSLNQTSATEGPPTRDVSFDESFDLGGTTSTTATAVTTPTADTPPPDAASSVFILHPPAAVAESAPTYAAASATAAAAISDANDCVACGLPQTSEDVHLLTLTPRPFDKNPVCERGRMKLSQLPVDSFVVAQLNAGCSIEYGESSGRGSVLLHDVGTGEQYLLGCGHQVNMSGARKRERGELYHRLDHNGEFIGALAYLWFNRMDAALFSIHPSTTVAHSFESVMHPCHAKRNMRFSVVLDSQRHFSFSLYGRYRKSYCMKDLTTNPPTPVVIEANELFLSDHQPAPQPGHSGAPITLSDGKALLGIIIGVIEPSYFYCTSIVDILSAAAMVDLNLRVVLQG